MRKLNSLHVGCLLALLLLSGCGMPGPLYQTPEKVPEPVSKTKIDKEPLTSEQTEQENS